MVKKLRSLPDFLGIGAQRCGTTWVYEQLRKHPEVWMPPVKELHYFNVMNKSHRIAKKRWKDFRKRLPTYLNRNNQENTPKDILWDFKYLFFRQSYSTYSYLFMPGENQIAGEITPAYSVLNLNDVQKIYVINPKMKIFFLMRDPLDRLWSNAIRVLTRDKNLDARHISNEEFTKFIEKKNNVLRTDYLRTLSIWESVFPPDQIYIDFYDTIRLMPKEFLISLYKFLGISPDPKYIPKNFRKKINHTDQYKTKIPDEIAIHIAESYIGQLETLSQRFGGPTIQWLDRANNLLEK